MAEGMERSLPTASPPAAGPAGERLGGRYLLQSPIGEGGMGVVHLAQDELLGRTVAIKVFRDGTADAARTTSETRLLAGLNHPALVTLFDAHVDGAAPNYLVMEFVDGPTLADRILRGPIPEDVVATMARDLADALHVVHAAGVVHRDIKPSNVLLRTSPVPGEEFRAKLADFGIAYLVDSTRLTTPGLLIGTAAYVSPEQVRGVAPTSAADIYALGLVLLESLTGVRAFAQDTPHEAALARLSQAPSIPAHLGPEWVALLTRMTATDPADRPSALDVVVAVNAFGGSGADGPTAGPTATAIATALDRVVTPSEAAQYAAASAPDVTIADGPVASESAVSWPAAVDQDAATRTLVGPQPQEARTPPGRRRWVPYVVAAVVVIAFVVAGLLIWGALAAPPAEPLMPSIDGPLGTHLDQLWDSVTP
ncbi:serine/threonine protein kinase [Microbacterium saccharophilum]|nr:serine/threonine protein kinase [Microbacterium saccharophilum]